MDIVVLGDRGINQTYNFIHTHTDLDWIITLRFAPILFLYPNEFSDIILFLDEVETFLEMLN